MNKQGKKGKATPNATLREQIMDSCIAKNEREHWARRKIAELEKENNKLKVRVERLKKGLKVV